MRRCGNALNIIIAIAITWRALAIIAKLFGAPSCREMLFAAWRGDINKFG